jgi:6-phosphogluconolactonase
MKPEVRIFTQPEIMADSLAEEFYRYANDQFITRNNLYVALSGGNTPMLFFKILSEFNNQKKNKVDWKRIQFFWGDERCVPPDDEDSNFGNANKVLFSVIDIPEGNVHRIQGENNPEAEAERYSKLMLQLVPSKNGIPIFDWVFLGVGEDGHTASIFPNQIEMINSTKICTVAKHPETGQLRITLTGTVINMAKRVTFMATGEEKQDVVKNIINNEVPSKKYPAAKIVPQSGRVDWYLDSLAADQI